MYIIRSKYVGLSLLIIAGLFVSCARKSTPPGASSVVGAVDGVNYSYSYWEEGLGILIWHNFSPGTEGCTGTGSTTDPVYRLVCHVRTDDGRQFEWEVQTRDGVTGAVWIDGHSIDLSQGAMFLLSSQIDGVRVKQLERDLSELEPNNEAIAAFARSDHDVASFVDAGEPESD